MKDKRLCGNCDSNCDYFYKDINEKSLLGLCNRYPPFRIKDPRHPIVDMIGVGNLSLNSQNK